MKGADGHYFTAPEFHDLFRGAHPVSHTITVPRLAFIVFKVMQFLGSEGAAGAGFGVSAAEDATTDKEMYDVALALCIKHPGKHWARRDDDDGNGTLLNIVVPPEVKVILAVLADVERYACACLPV